MPDEDWDYGTIYTSPTSMKILLLRFPHLRPHVTPLELQTPHIIRGRTVTLYEANHCPGAVMFLFQGPNPALQKEKRPSEMKERKSMSPNRQGSEQQPSCNEPKIQSKDGNLTILHTGDFRFKSAMLDHFKIKAAHPTCSSEGEEEKAEEQLYIEIDRLYMDNTFATSAEDFPTQEEAFDQLFNIITQKKREYDEAVLNISVDSSSNKTKKAALKALKPLKFNLYCYTLGKEEIFHSLARNFDTKV